MKTLHFYEKLSFALEKRGVSQSELARRIGVSQPFINQLAGGSRQPYLGLAVAVSKALNVSLEWLGDDSLPVADIRERGAELGRDERLLLSLARLIGFDRCLSILEAGMGGDSGRRG